MLERGLLEKSVASRLNFAYGLNIDLSRATPDKSIIDLGKNNKEKKMPTELTDEQIEQLQADKVAAEKKVKDAEAAQAKAETERDALKGDSAALTREIADRKAGCLDKYKDFRSANLTGQDLLDYEKTLDKLDLHELKVQEDILGAEVSSDESGEGVDDKAVKAGRTTSDTDKSKKEDKDENAAENQKHLPPWMDVNRTSKNVNV